MGRRKFLIMLLVLGTWFLAPVTGPEGGAAEPKVTQVIYVTVSKACGCTLDRCQAGDLVVETAFAGERQGLLKRLDYSTDKETARQYIKKYRLTMPPSLIFLDAQGNILWRTEGDLDYDTVLEKLKQFGA